MTSRHTIIIITLLILLGQWWYDKIPCCLRGPENTNIPKCCIGMDMDGDRDIDLYDMGLRQVKGF